MHYIRSIKAMLEWELTTNGKDDKMEDMKHSQGELKIEDMVGGLIAAAICFGLFTLALSL